jgi:hypothetical protein
MLGASQAALLGAASAAVTYDSLVAIFHPNVVSYWKFENNGVDENGTQSASINGSPEFNVATIVDLDTIAEGASANGECIAWPGAVGVYAEAAHNAAHKTPQGTIVVTFQNDNLAQKSTLVAADASNAAGGLALEVQTDGSPRCFLRRQSDGAPVVLVGQAGDVQLNEAYTLIFKWGPPGLSMALWNEEGFRVRQVSDLLTDGVTGTSPIRFGIWHDGVQSAHDGPYGRAIWLNRRISDGEEAILARAKTIVHGGTSAITLDPIYMWKDDRDNGEHKITDTATGGAIQSSSGGTLPAFPLTVDPTPYVSGASGGKSGWSAQFRNSTGSWTRLGSGDFQFTPGITAGEDHAEYRVSDDGGGTWSNWQSLTTLVLDRSLCPGPYFLVEDYSGGGSSWNGVDTPRFNSARDAAVAAGGGTVTSLQRSTVRFVTNHVMKAKVHYLFPNVKRPDMIHTPSGQGCSPGGNGQGNNWEPTWQEPVFDGETGDNLAGQARVNIVGGIFDGNMLKQAIHNGFQGTPASSSEYGKCWPGNRTNSSAFNLQLQRLIRLQGSTASGAGGRARLGCYAVTFQNTPGDAIHGTGASDGIIEDCRFSGTFRGGLVWDFGNSVLVARRNSYVNSLGTTNSSQNVGAGIDHEILGFGGSFSLDILHEDEFIDGDFEFNPREGPGHIVRGCVIGPGLDWLAKGTVNAQVITHEGSAKNPRGTIRYHRKAPTGGNFPACSIRGWAGVTPHNMMVKFIDQDFLTWGTFYIYHEKLIVPTAGVWEIEIGETTDTSSNFRVEVTNCTARVGPNMPSGSNTIRLFRTVKALTTTQVVRIDGLAIGSGFQQAAIQLNGQRLEHRNVVHEDFPSASIQQICPGAGQYVAI